MRDLAPFVTVSGSGVYDCLWAGIPDDQVGAGDLEVDRNQSAHNYNKEIWSGRLMKAKDNYTKMLVKWDRPNATDNTLCAFKLHYYRGNSTMRGSTIMLLL